MASKTLQAFAPIRQAAPVKRGDRSKELKPVQEFLQRFGYLKKGSFKQSVLDDQTSEALKKYQRANGRRAIGEFNRATRDQMTTHRCGHPDMDSGLAFTALCFWDKSELKYAFGPGTSDIAGSAEFQAVRDAFQSWEAVTPLTFTEVDLDQDPDIAIDWRNAADPDHSMVGGVLAHADFPPGCSVVTDTLPKPVHFDDSEHNWVIGAVSGGFDVETVALHELGHILGLAHSSVAGSVMFASVSSNSTKRALTADDISGVQSLYQTPIAAPIALSSGVHTIQQKSNNRFVDAHESGNSSVVTRTAQNNDTQRWTLTRIGSVYTIQQKSNNRFVDAHESGDFSAVTRTAQNNDTQRWVLLPVEEHLSTYTIQQLRKARFVDAHENSGADFSVVTRTAQNNDTQRWVLASIGNAHTIRQLSSGRFMDAHEHSGADFSVVTRTAQRNNTQRWILTLIGGVYTIQQKSNSRFLDAHVTRSADFSVVTRTAQNNDTQRWVLFRSGTDAFTIQQLSSNRFVDAHEHSGADFSVVTRTAQNNNTQRWLIRPV